MKTMVQTVIHMAVVLLCLLGCFLGLQQSAFADGIWNKKYKPCPNLSNSRYYKGSPMGNSVAVAGYQWAVGRPRCSRMLYDVNFIENDPKKGIRAPIFKAISGSDSARSAVSFIFMMRFD